MSPKAKIHLILCGNFDYVCQRGPDGSTFELKPDIKLDTRRNPNDFIDEIIEPICELLSCHETCVLDKHCVLGQVRWARGQVHEHCPAVDVGSSKCELLRMVGGEIETPGDVAPSFTEQVTFAKAKEQGVPQWKMEEHLIRGQYERLVSFLVRCYLEGAKLRATGGVRRMVSNTGLANQFVTAHELLQDRACPVRGHYETDRNLLEPIMREIQVEMISPDEEARLELKDARHQFKDVLPKELPPGDRLVFISMGGQTTQVICVNAKGEEKIKSFQVGKNHYRKDESVRQRCKKENDELCDFLKQSLK